MTHHQVDIIDCSNAKDSAKPAIKREERRYRVLNPIFKNGRLYPIGEEVILEKKTGDRFVKTGDVEEIK